MDTLGLAPSSNAVSLFDGDNLDNWTTRDGQPAGWTVEDQVMHVVPGTGDIQSKERFADFYLHLEFRCPDMPEATGQAKGNSGVFLQGRYEIQVLDSYGLNMPGMGDCGAVYNQFAPLTNACKPPLDWQTYDVFFRAPRAGAPGPLLLQDHNDLVCYRNIWATELALAGSDTYEPR